jgi:MarR-like DNA-binding transcriptional regulator SgrR of sgrS sRNA
MLPKTGHALTATDVASAWTELRSLLNNAHSWTFKALSDIKTTVPFPVLEFHNDNGRRMARRRSKKAGAE